MKALTKMLKKPCLQPTRRLPSSTRSPGGKVLSARAWRRKKSQEDIEMRTSQRGSSRKRYRKCRTLQKSSSQTKRTRISTSFVKMNFYRKLSSRKSMPSIVINNSSSTRVSPFKKHIRPSTQRHSRHFKSTGDKHDFGKFSARKTKPKPKPKRNNRRNLSQHGE